MKNHNENTLANAITTLPTSIRQRLEMARDLKSEGRTQEADVAFYQAVEEVGRTEPALAALMATAWKHGSAYLMRKRRETVERMQRIERSFFGIPVSEEWIKVPENRLIEELIQLGIKP
jgi:hypothetical protein